MASGTSPASFLTVQGLQNRLLQVRVFLALLFCVSVLWRLQKNATLVKSLLCQGEGKVKGWAPFSSWNLLPHEFWLLQTPPPLPIFQGLCHKLSA